MTKLSGVRLIALVEAAKGMLVLLAGFGLLELVHRNIQGLAEEIVQHFHLNPASHYPRIFIEASTHLNDTNLSLLAGAALLYSGLRLCEAYGLWQDQCWAKWLGAVSGVIYIPIELYELLHGVTWAKATLLWVNAICVAYLVQSLRRHS